MVISSFTGTQKHNAEIFRKIMHILNWGKNIQHNYDILSGEEASKQQKKRKKQKKCTYNFDYHHECDKYPDQIVGRGQPTTLRKKANTYRKK